MFGLDKLSHSEVANWIFNSVSSSGGNHHNLKNLFEKNIAQIRRGAKGVGLGTKEDIPVMMEYLYLYEEELKNYGFGVKYQKKADDGICIDFDAGARHPKEADYEDFWPSPNQ